MEDIASGGHELCAAYARQFGFPMGAANLCHFTRHFADEESRQRLDLVFERAISRLIETRGEILNAHLQKPSLPRELTLRAPPKQAGLPLAGCPLLLRQKGIPSLPQKYSIITTCKGRLHNLARTLHEFLKQGQTEVIVVDYDCPDGTSEYVARNYPLARLVSVTDQPKFNTSHARNLGAAQAAVNFWCF